jgi:hypothetical protein
MLCAALAAALSGCRQPAGPPPVSGGLARGDAARLSLLVAQSRAQHPELSATGLRPAPRRAADGASRPAELALRGNGLGVRPGVQIGEPQPVALALFLDKSHYHAGYARLSFAGQPEETWRIVAYDARGDPKEAFELLYALADPESRVRYLGVLGGYFEQEGRRFLAFEGTLVIPGKGARLEDWERIYKIDFGFKHPAEPLFLAEVERANGLFAGLQQAVAGLGARRDRIELARREREELARQAPSSGQAPGREEELARRDAELVGMRDEQTRAAKEAEALLLGYWALRVSIDTHFAEFAESNAYRWHDRAGQQAWYDQWRQVEFHHPRIDEWQRTLAGFLPDGTALDQARAQAMAVIGRLDNRAKDPSRSNAR